MNSTSDNGCVGGVLEGRPLHLPVAVEHVVLKLAPVLIAVAEPQ